MPQSRIDYEQNGSNGMLGGFIHDMLGTNGRGDYEGRLKAYLDQYAQRQAPQAGAAAQSATSGFRANQNDLVGRLEAMSRGQGPSLAREQLRESTDRNMRQQSSIAQTGRGNAALAGIQASNASGMLGSQSAQQAVQGRLAEQQMAFSQLGQAVGQGREQDQQNSQFNALQTNYRDQFNVEARLRTMGMNDQQIAAILQQLGQQVNQPSQGEQLLAGAAGLAGAAIGAQGGGGKK